MASNNLALVHGMLSCIKGSRVLSFCEKTSDTSSLLNCTADGRSANYLAEIFAFDNPIQVNELSSSESLGSNGQTNRSSFNMLDTEIIKIIIVGDQRVGKSELFKILTNEEFSWPWRFSGTQNTSFGSTVCCLKNNYYIIEFWDRTGDKKLLDDVDIDCSEFYEGAKAALVVYDLTRLNDTLPNAIKWKERIDRFTSRKPGESIPMVLVGNKCDATVFQDGAIFAETYGFIGHCRSSAVLIPRVGIDRALEMLVREVMKTR